MRYQIATLALAALIGFSALPAQAHIASIGYNAEKIRHTQYSVQDLEKVCPDIMNLKPENFSQASYEVPATDPEQLQWVPVTVLAQAAETDI